MSALRKGVYNKMKNLKFRVYNKEDKVLFYVGENPDLTKYPADVYEINQWTGLLDRSGKEIYEGDIFQWNRYGVRSNKQIRPIYKGIVKFEPYALSTIKNIISGNGTLKVIGNIYENPELLKEPTQ